jgi:hypothetical protein
MTAGKEFYPQLKLLNFRHGIQGRKAGDKNEKAGHKKSNSSSCRRGKSADRIALLLCFFAGLGWGWIGFQ